jgi:hypothetical protein
LDRRDIVAIPTKVNGRRAAAGGQRGEIAIEKRRAASEENDA